MRYEINRNKIMSDAAERRLIINSYYKHGMKRGLWFGFMIGFFVALILGGVIK